MSQTSTTIAPHEPKVHKWTRDEYYRLAELGWFRDRRVELIDGSIFEMPAQKNPHVVSVALTEDRLKLAFGLGFWVRVQAPLALGPLSEPEPDLAVVPGSPRDYNDHPTSALLVAEVSDATLSYDRNQKGSLYAAAGIADYWIVNLVDRQLEIYRNPVPDPTQPYGFRYADKTVLTPGAAASPLAAPQSQIPVADLLP